MICLLHLSACNSHSGNTTFNGLPSDNELRSHFNRHRKDFESLRNMIIDDKKITVVKPDLINAASKKLGSLAWSVPTKGGPPEVMNDKDFFVSDYFNSLGIDKVRFDKYCELLQSAGADMITKNSDNVAFQMVYFRPSLRTDERDILYAPNEPLMGLCDDTLKGQESRDRVINATHLSGNDWFITYTSVTSCP